MISDGQKASIGSLTAGKEWFKPWKTIEGDQQAPASLPELQVLIQGVFEKRSLLNQLRYFIKF